MFDLFGPDGSSLMMPLSLMMLALGGAALAWPLVTQERGRNDLKRRLRVEVQRTTLEGDEQKGSAEVDFDATGFGPGCDPTRPPRFVEQTATETKPATPADTSQPAPDQHKPDTGTTKPEPKEDDDSIVPPPDKPGFAPLSEPKK